MSDAWGVNLTLNLSVIIQAEPRPLPVLFACLLELGHGARRERVESLAEMRGQGVHGLSVLDDEKVVQDLKSLLQRVFGGFVGFTPRFY
jgi:hypothetical protein